MDASGDREGTGGAGFTLVEVIVTVVFLVVITSIALPPLNQMRSDAARQSARSAITVAVVRARGEAVRRGRIATLHVDDTTGRLWIVVDTGSAGSGADTATVAILDLAGETGVTLASDRSAICFASRGMLVVANGCPARGARLVVSREGKSDTLDITPLGRVVR